MVAWLTANLILVIGLFLLYGLIVAFWVILENRTLAAIATLRAEGST